MGRTAINNPKEVRIKLGKESINKLEDMHPFLSVTTQIRDTIEYAHNNTF